MRAVAELPTFSKALSSHFQTQHFTRNIDCRQQQVESEAK